MKETETPQPAANQEAIDPAVGQRENLARRLSSFFEKASDVDGKKLLDDAHKNLYDVQKYLVAKRVFLLTLFGVYILLWFNVVQLDSIPGTIGKANGDLKFFTTLNAATLCFLPIVYVGTHYLIVNSLIYRSQMRLILKKGYERFYPYIVQRNLDVYANPYSPGGSLKGLARLKEGDGAREKKSLRKYISKAEQYFAWVGIVVMVAFSFYRIMWLYMYPHLCDGENATCANANIEFWSFILGVTAVSLISYLGTVKHAKGYVG